MIRSNFAITRLIVIPFGALFTLYLLVVGGGGLWLYSQARSAELRMLMDQLVAQVSPLVEKLGKTDVMAQRNETWLQDDVSALFSGLPSLRSVAVRDTHAGYQFDSEGRQASIVAPLPSGATATAAEAGPHQRFDRENGESFVIRFDLSDEAAPLVRLDFGFDRAALIASLDHELSRIRKAVLMFAFAGGLSILVALLIALYAMRMTRRVESEFQEIYQRASLTEMAASLVHDLRNPLMALRANARALLLAPDDAADIAQELDRDIVTLNDKLSAFLNLTRRHDSDFAPVDVAALVDAAVRQAQPTAQVQGLTIRVDVEPQLPQPIWRAASVQDALLNVLLNAAQSGQRQGDVVLRVRRLGNEVEMVVEDRGRGISKAHLPRLFDAFYTTREDGNGLGLAIVQRVVAAHRGKVAIANREGGGARVTMLLPIQPQEMPEWWKKLKKDSPI